MAVKIMGGLGPTRSRAVTVRRSLQLRGGASARDRIGAPGCAGGSVGALLTSRANIG